MSRRISSRIFIGALTLAAAACMTLADARAFDESKYPEWYGQWTRPNGVGNQWDPTKPGGPAQQAPLTPEYQADLRGKSRRPGGRRRRAPIRPDAAFRPACRA